MEKRCFGCMYPTDEAVCPRCGYHREQDNQLHQLPVGTVLRDQYLIGRVLGQGGFGITYLGWDLNLSIPVAIKEFYPLSIVNRDSTMSLMVRTNTVDMESGFVNSKSRFLREAQALARLQNIPEIVRIQTCFQTNGTAYIVMEYIRGTELNGYVQMKGGTLSVGETLRLLRPVMEALAVVHREGMVHRDISPDNIMLHPMGGAKLLDFGAVRSVVDADTEKDLTHSTESILKRGFAPPEQYRNRGSLGPWTDEYALCGTIYYCLTGKVPPDAMGRFLDEEHPDWSGIPDLSDRQRKALEKGMAVKARDRYPSMQELMAELYAPEEAPVQQEPIPQPPIPEPVPEPPKPEPAPHVPQPVPKSKVRAPKNKRKAPRFLIPALLAVVVIAAAALILPGILAQNKPAGPAETSASADIPTGPVSLSGCQVNDIVEFGLYEQYGLNHSMESIEWIVLAREDDRALLLSRYVLEAVPYHTSARRVIWKNSYLRQWLNDDFLNLAFTQEEQSRILFAPLEDPYSPVRKVSDNSDLVFLLSADKAEEFFPNPEQRLAQATSAAGKNGVQILESGYSPWWSHFAGYGINDTAVIHGDGQFEYYYYIASEETIGVRPAIWIDLSE